VSRNRPYIHKILPWRLPEPLIWHRHLECCKQAPDLCLDIINVLKFIMRSNARFADVLSVLPYGIQIQRGVFWIASWRISIFCWRRIPAWSSGWICYKVMKVAAIVIGLFVAGLAYLSYRGWVDVRWVAMEDASRSMLTNASEQVVHALITELTLVSFSSA